MEPNPNSDERSLIAQAQVGSDAAFQILVSLHAERLLRCAMTLSRDRQLAEDIAQETLLEAWRCIQRFDGRCQFSTWMYGILRHRHLRTAKKRSKMERGGDLSDELPEPLTTEDDASRRSQKDEDVNQVRKAVESLPEEHRVVIELRFFAELQLNEIASALKLPLGTVKSRLHNGLEKLRKQKMSLNLFDTRGQSPLR